jgi:hypothetical protein
VKILIQSVEKYRKARPDTRVMIWFTGLACIIAVVVVVLARGVLD